MLKNFPDKWIRKAIYDRIHNLDAGGLTLPCFDTTTGTYTGDFYTIMSTQTAEGLKDKCGGGWRSTILIEAFTRTKKNTMSRVAADDILQEVLELMEDFNLDPASGLRVQQIEWSSPNDINDKQFGEIIHRKFLRYEMTLK